MSFVGSAACSEPYNRPRDVDYLPSLTFGLGFPFGGQVGRYVVHLEEQALPEQRCVVGAQQCVDITSIVHSRGNHHRNTTRVVTSLLHIHLTCRSGAYGVGDASTEEGVESIQTAVPQDEARVGSNRGPPWQIYVPTAVLGLDVYVKQLVSNVVNLRASHFDPHEACRPPSTRQRDRDGCGDDVGIFWKGVSPDGSGKVGWEQSCAFGDDSVNKSVPWL